MKTEIRSLKIVGKNGLLRDRAPLEDPMSSVANLFDVSVVFIVALIFALISAFNMLDMFDPNSEVTYTRKSSNGEIQMVTKKGKQIEVEKVSPTDASGKGVRLGTAYKLENGQVIYVPE